MIQTKPKPRLSDGIVKACYGSFVHNGSLTNMGIAIRAGTAPLLVLSMDTALQNGTAGRGEYVTTSTMTGAVFGSLGGIVAATGNYRDDLLGPPAHPSLLGTSVKFGGLGSFTATTTMPQEFIPEISTNGLGNALIARSVGRIGRFRKQGRIVAPQTALAYHIVGTEAFASGETMPFYVEYIEGDYDYSEFLKNGMAPLNY